MSGVNSLQAKQDLQILICKQDELIRILMEDNLFLLCFWHVFLRRIIQFTVPQTNSSMPERLVNLFQKF